MTIRANDPRLADIQGLLSECSEMLGESPDDILRSLESLSDKKEMPMNVLARIRELGREEKCAVVPINSSVIF